MAVSRNDGFGGSLPGAFGPVTSRRLGRIIGVNNIPAKVCTNACVYCQGGPTTFQTSHRHWFFDPDELTAEVSAKYNETRAAGVNIDYIAIVPDGEPTVDLALGTLVKGLRNIGPPVAVMTNSSLIWRNDVREELMAANWVSLKVDAVVNDLWQHVDRPHRYLNMERMLGGMRAFAAAYRGTLVTETMLIRGLSDRLDNIERVARFLGALRPECAYITVPTRPPCENWVEPPYSEAVEHAASCIRNHVKRVECLIEHQKCEYSCTGDLIKDIMSFTITHPLERHAIEQILERSGADWAKIDELIDQGRLERVVYKDKEFYVRVAQPFAN